MTREERPLKLSHQRSLVKEVFEPKLGAEMHKCKSPEAGADLDVAAAFKLGENGGYVVLY